MRRRDFVRAIVGSATAWPLTLRAQQPGRMRRVGLLVGLAEDDPETKSRVRAFRLGLRDADWVEGRNIRIDYRFSVSDPARAKQYAAELMSGRKIHAGIATSQRHGYGGDHPLESPERDVVAIIDSWSSPLSH
jgi:hypothetical protein